MGLAETAELAVRISLKDNASAGIRGLQRNLGGLSGSVSRVGRGFGQIGTGLARAGLLVGGAAIGGITAAAKAAVDFEDAFAGVRKTVDEAELTAVGLTFEDLARSFRDMATEIPIAATELARLGETAGALGVHVEDIDDFVRVTALLGETTDLSADQAAEALGKVGTILGLTGKEYEHFADILVNLGNKGASTESEILEVAKRFAGIGRQAGLTNEQVLALSSTITSLGAEPEAGGSALSRIFSNIAFEIANATKKGKTFAKLTGDSLDELKTRIDRGDALGIFRETLEGIAKLSRTEQASVLRALGITNVRDRDAIVKMANDTSLLDRNLQNAGDSASALAIEAAKRFDTTQSKLVLLGNAAKELGITFGIEVLPAIKRAAVAISDVLSDPDVKADAQQFGKDVAKFIDEIDWQQVKEGAMAFAQTLKGAADFAILLLKAIDKLPGELKAAAAGFLVLNKLSGGLIGAGVGNVVGGLAETAARAGGSRLPGIGKLFAQPVFVTNWPMGFGAGGGTGVVGAARGGLSTISKVFLVGEAIGLAALVLDVKNSITEGHRQQVAQIGQDLTTVIERGTPAEMVQALAGINQGIAQIEAYSKDTALGVDGLPERFKEPFRALLAERSRLIAAIRAQTAAEKTAREDIPADQVRANAATARRLDLVKGAISGLVDAVQAADEAAQAKANALRERTEAKMEALRQAEQAVRDRVESNRIATQSGLANVRTTTANIGSAIVAAIRANRPIVNVSVTGMTQTVVRTGQTLNEYGGGKRK